jgi:hypothetical protein
MAVTDSSPKPHAYDLMNRLNAALARVNRNLSNLTETGMFPAETMERLSRLSEQTRADMNSSLLKTLAEVEERDLGTYRR